MAISTIPGYPRIGKHRELKWALEAFWSGKRSESELAATAAAMRMESRSVQRSAGLDLLPVNDFSLYDQMLDASVLVGAIPARFGFPGGQVDFDTYFAMARGRANDRPVAALDMTKWFDSNYHFLVPELAETQAFALSSDKPFAELAEAITAGVNTKVALIGPVSYLLLARSAGEPFDPATLLERLLPVYEEIVARLAAAGATWIQFDESAFALDRSPGEIALLETAYTRLAAVKGATRLAIHTAYGHLGDAYPTVVALPVDAVGLDLVHGKKNLDLLHEHGFPAGKDLVAGVVDGRNIWINNLDASLTLLESLAAKVGHERIQVSSSSTLLHTPYDVLLEEQLDPEIVPWLAFAEQKLGEIVLLARGLNEGRDAIAPNLAERTALLAARDQSSLTRNPAVRARVANAASDEAGRTSPFAVRRDLQHDRLKLPLLPTTTIGSFPQTNDVRRARRDFDNGDLSPADYDAFLKDRTQDVIRLQEEIGIDMLVHGEFERNDMVQYFGEQLDGFAFTHLAWVQSYGSRCVRPPVIYGDVSRPAPMTVEWATFAQSLTERPVKGMLTGPVTILNWSFVRDDQPRAETCRQIALAIRDEVADLDAAGIAAIQIDEPALREGLPLRRAEWGAYLEWAVACFRTTASGARDETQIHTHMCYSDFGDIIGAISALDADVISIENARSDNALLEDFRANGYDKEIGPGVYDIHSPRVAPVSEMVANIEASLDVLGLRQLWVNPDCGLKTRKPDEARNQLIAMVAAAREVRERVGAGQPVR